eukprot:1807760-Prymnesium_polylepis.1
MLAVRPMCWRSPGKGWGVVAAEDIREGDFVIEYVGEVVSREEAARREARCPESADYFFDAGPYTIDAYAVRNLAAFVNFGCQPNLEMRSVPGLHRDPKLPRVGFFAKQHIPEGRELTYRRDPNANTVRKRAGFANSRTCECGATTCVGYI